MKSNLHYLNCSADCHGQTCVISSRNRSGILVPFCYPAFIPLFYPGRTKINWSWTECLLNTVTWCQDIFRLICQTSKRRAAQNKNLDFNFICSLLSFDEISAICQNILVLRNLFFPAVHRWWCNFFPKIRFLSSDCNKKDLFVWNLIAPPIISCANCRL